MEHQEDPPIESPRTLIEYCVVFCIAMIAFVIIGLVYKIVFMLIPITILGVSIFLIYRLVRRNP